MKISLLTLYTSRLEDQVDFYLNTLGLKLERRTSEAAEFKIGYSTLRFEYRKNATPYHFAVNIPSHKAAEALTWLKKRVPILKDRDDEIVAFSSNFKLRGDINFDFVKGEIIPNQGYGFRT